MRFFLESESAFLSGVFLARLRVARVFRSFGEIARTRRKNMVFSQV